MAINFALEICSLITTHGYLPWPSCKTYFPDDAAFQTCVTLHECNVNLVAMGEEFVEYTPSTPN